MIIIGAIIILAVIIIESIIYVRHVVPYMPFALYQAPNEDSTYIKAYAHDIFDQVHSEMKTRQEGALAFNGGTRGGAAKVYLIVPYENGTKLPTNATHEQLLAVIGNNQQLYPRI